MLPSPTSATRRRRRLRHLERRSRPALRSRAIGDLRVAADGRVRGSRRLRIVADLSRLRRRLVSDGRRAGLGAVSATATGRTSGLGPDVGRSSRPGAMRRSTTVAGPTSAVVGGGAPARTQGVRSGRRRSSPGTAARAGAAPSGMARRSTAGCRSGWRRGVSPLVAPVLVQLLGALQPALCGERHGAPERAARRAMRISPCRAQCRPSRPRRSSAEGR